MKVIGQRKIQVGLMSFGMMISIGCKKLEDTSGSNVKTLGNLEEGSITTRNSCGSDLNSNKSKFDFAKIESQVKIEVKKIDGVNKVDKAELRRKVYETLTSIHPIVLSQFFLGHQGRIVVGPIGNRCSHAGVGKKSSESEKADKDRVLESTKEGTPLACWKIEEKDLDPVVIDGEEITGTYKQPVIYLDDGSKSKQWTTEKIIGHALVREFGYMIPGFLSHYKFVPPQPESEDQVVLLIPMEVSPADGIFYEELSGSFYEDLADRKSKNAKKKLKPFWIFAEAFDSYFCSIESNAKFNDTYPKSYRVFDAFFAQMFEQIYQKKPAESVAAEENDAPALGLIGGNQNGYDNDPYNAASQRQRYYGNTNYRDCNTSNGKGGYNYNYDARRQGYPQGGAGYVPPGKEYQMVKVQGRLDGLGACQSNYVNRDYYQYGNGGGAYRYGTGVNGYAGVATNLFASTAQLGLSIYAQYLIQKSTYRPRVTLPRYQNSQVAFGTSSGCGVQNGGGSIGFGGTVTFGGATGSNFSGNNGTGYDNSYNNGDNNSQYNKNGYDSGHGSNNGSNNNGNNPYQQCSGMFGNSGDYNNGFGNGYNSGNGGGYTDYNKGYNDNYDNGYGSSNDSGYDSGSAYSASNSYTETNNNYDTPAKTTKKKKKKKSACGVLSDHGGNLNLMSLIILLLFGCTAPIAGAIKKK